MKFFAKDGSAVGRAAAASAVLAMAMSACSGGGGGSSAPIVAPSTGGTSTPPAPTPSPTPMPTTGPQSSASATGTVVDYAANTPLSGVKVALAAYTHGAAATQVATTNASGQFTFSTTPGTYFLVIGSDSATDTTTTLHAKITLVAGANALTAPIPPAEPQVTLTAAQQSGKFRLTALAGNQESCYTGSNQGRSQDSLPLLIPDEYLAETSTAIAQEGNAEPQYGAEPVPLFTSLFSYETAIGGVALAGATTSGFSDPCPIFTGPSFAYVSGTEPFVYATNPANVYYGANGVGVSSPLSGVSAQVWAADPR